MVEHVRGRQRRGPASTTPRSPRSRTRATDDRPSTLRSPPTTRRPPTRRARRRDSEPPRGSARSQPRQLGRTQVTQASPSGRAAQAARPERYRRAVMADDDQVVIEHPESAQGVVPARSPRGHRAPDRLRGGRPDHHDRRLGRDRGRQARSRLVFIAIYVVLGALRRPLEPRGATDDRRTGDHPRASSARSPRPPGSIATGPASPTRRSAPASSACCARCSSRSRSPAARAR